MSRRLGWLALGGAVGGWAILFVTLAFGGLDPEPSVAPRLQAAVLAATFLSVPALVTAGVALAKGRQRPAAAIGALLSLLYLLALTGI